MAQLRGWGDSRAFGKVGGETLSLFSLMKPGNSGCGLKAERRVLGPSE